jgi:hypothetical protein
MSFLLLTDNVHIVMFNNVHVLQIINWCPQRELEL